MFHVIFHVIKPLVLTAALTAGLSAVAAQTAGAAAASGPPGSTPAYSATQAGYVASGRDFRFAQAVIMVPATACSEASPAEYVALRSGGNSAGAGLACLSGHWSAFAARSISHLYGPHTDWATLPGVQPGDGVLVSVYFDRARDKLRFSVVPPLVPASYFTMTSPAKVYPRAEALTDWSQPTPSSSVQVTRGGGTPTFPRGRFTTVSGTHGPFQGPWRLEVYRVTGSGGTPPYRALSAQPPRLWADSGRTRDRAG